MAEFNTALLPELMQKAGIGWWEADFQKQHYICSAFISELLGLGEDNLISFADFRKLIREDYRERTVQEFRFGKTQNQYDQIYPLETTRGIRWIRVKLCSKKTDANGNLWTYGFMECLDTPDPLSPEAQALQRVNSMFVQQDSIFNSLYSLFHTKDTIALINQILDKILQQYPDGNIYIIEYNEEKHQHIYHYQANNNAVRYPQFYTESGNSWWIQQLIRKAVPIILNNIDELPAEAVAEKRDLTALGIKSIMGYRFFPKIGCGDMLYCISSTKPISGKRKITFGFPP